MQNRRPNLFTPKSDQPAKPTDKNNDNLEKINEFITSIETTISELKKDKLLSYPLQSNLQQMTVSQHIETYINLSYG
ncbi:hypothetical protein [Aquicella lusitana]|uniref:Uncharacterized protein n=1 Tax=Aquicella lusitana TaxID=254246 RepID=A0A370GCA3_9COXI|nr:hypothetical protein [Aquicella lusitana]RDI40084.1 hypothetical protein C8D86_12434 [Aquicella lusitana]VVC72364.1 hypothetical protein AQULUS_00740 [Aquicella lusitana]